MIKHVKADSLGSVFTDSTLSVFTDYARDNGVTIDSIIFITCDHTDADAFGEEFKEGSKWIWTKEGLYANATYPISNSEIDDIFDDEFEGVGSDGIGGGSSTVDLSNYYTKDETDTKFATVETVGSKADASQVTALSTQVTTLSTKVDGKAETSQVTNLSTQFTTLSTKVDGKADASQVDTLNTTFTSALAGKASTADVQALQTAVSTVQTELGTKVPVTTVNALQTATETAQAGVNAIGYETGVISAEDSNGWDNSGTTMDATYTKIGDICYITIKQAGLPATWWDVYYSLPITPASNISGICMSSSNEAIHYTTVLNYKSSGIPVLKLERQYGGQGFSGGTVSFVLMYKYK